MCGVIGFSCEKPNKENISILNNLIYQSKIRGLHSFGYSYIDGLIKTEKHHDINSVKLPMSNKIIYHNRYSTSGDYKNHENNQPICNNEMSLVFNGVLDMGTKEEIENKYNIKMETENDGEIILKNCGANIDLINKFVKETSGSFAGMILTKSNKLLAIRNSKRPLWQLNHLGCVYLASTKDIFKRVDNSFEPTQLKENTIYEY